MRSELVGTVSAAFLLAALPALAQNPERDAYYGETHFHTGCGDKHYAARSNEFGYANYELISVPAQLGTEVHFNLTQ